MKGLTSEDKQFMFDAMANREPVEGCKERGGVTEATSQEMSQKIDPCICFKTEMHKATESLRD